MPGKVSKLDGAKRQLETAIDLFFDSQDSLSVHTLAWAAFKVLFDLYPHRSDDGFATKLDSIIGKEGWRSMSGVANFLKHADKDPEALLVSHHPMQGMALIGLATILYRRIAGEFTVKMMAFDYCMEELAFDELGIPEADENKERAARFRAIRNQIRDLPFDAQIVVAKKLYLSFLENYEVARSRVEQANADGLTVTQLLDRHIPNRDFG
ncbi:hypothetical protein [Roseomonas chloroacetimidivorans]|uniref:hypothetical protein n=1 Tax=Roseomonas chloroacetimidivorans TaxID=1766656 RepID=UPI003C7949BA